MKVLIALVLAQILLLSLALARIGGLEAQVAQPGWATITGPEPQHSPQADGSSAQPATSAPSATLLRRIVREELDAALSALRPEPVPDAPEHAWAPDPQEQAQLAERVWLRLDELKANGAASSTELNDLISSMVQLEPGLSNLLLNELNAAMNRGEIKGRL